MRITVLVNKNLRESLQSQQQGGAVVSSLKQAAHALLNVSRSTPVEIIFDTNSPLAVFRLLEQDDSVVAEHEAPLSDYVNAADLPAVGYIKSVGRAAWAEIIRIEEISDRTSGLAYKRIARLERQAEAVGEELRLIEEQQVKVPPAAPLDLARIEALYKRVVKLRSDAEAIGAERVIQGYVRLPKPLTGLIDDGYEALTRWLYERVQRLEPALDDYELKHGSGGGDALLILTEPESVEITIEGYAATVASIAKEASYAALDLKQLHLLRKKTEALQGETRTTAQAKELQSLLEKIEQVHREVSSKDPVTYRGSEEIDELQKRLKKLRKKRPARSR